MTLRQLVWMTEGRDRHDWSVVSALMSLIANCHKDAKTKSFSPDDFNPTLSKEEKRSSALLITDENAEIMRNEFQQVFEIRREA